MFYRIEQYAGNPIVVHLDSYYNPVSLRPSCHEPEKFCNEALRYVMRRVSGALYVVVPW